MSAILARSAAPPYALRVWCDNTAVYTEIPGKPGGMPHVMSFSLSEGGLSKCLNLLRGKNATFHGRVDFSEPMHYSPPPVYPSNRPQAGTDIQRAHAQAVLKRLRII